MPIIKGVMRMWLLFEILVNIYQGFLTVYFIRHRLHLKRKGYWEGAICVGAVALFLSLYLVWDIPLLDTVIFIVPFLYALFVSDEKIGVSLFWSAVLAFLFIASATLTSAFFQAMPDATWDLLMQPSGLRIAFVIICNVVTTLVLFGVSHWRRGNNTQSRLALCVFVILVALQLVAVEFLFTLRLHITEELDSTFIAACLCIMGCCILALVLYDIFAKNTARQVLIQTELEHLRVTQEHQEEIRNVYENLSIFRHDLKQQIQAVEQLVAENNVPEANAYFDSLRQTEANFPTYLTGNAAVDALLTAKTLVMQERGIAFDFERYPLFDLPISDTAFCSLVGNLLDNAIEAIGRMQKTDKKPLIQFSFARVPGNLFITCENDMDPSTLRRSAGHFITSKSGIHHGIGLRSIERIVKEVKGYCLIEPRKSTFYVRINLPCLNRAPASSASRTQSSVSV